MNVLISIENVVYATPEKKRDREKDRRKKNRECHVIGVFACK